MSNRSNRPLIIVESPTKARTISRFMKAKYDVKASMGHIRDLPKSKLGVDIEDGFKPQYITIRGKGNAIKELREAQPGIRCLLGYRPRQRGGSNPTASVPCAGHRSPEAKG